MKADMCAVGPESLQLQPNPIWFDPHLVADSFEVPSLVETVSEFWPTPIWSTLCFGRHCVLVDILVWSNPIW